MAVPTNAVHDSFSFISIQPSNVTLSWIKEIEPYIREAPEWFYKPTMGELAIIIRCQELCGIATQAQVSFHEIFDIHEIQQVDFLEHVAHQYVDPSPFTLDENVLEFSLKPHECKNFMIIVKIPLEDQDL